LARQPGDAKDPARPTGFVYRGPPAGSARACLRASTIGASASSSTWMLATPSHSRQPLASRPCVAACLASISSTH
ncbi:hypothetical protein BAE44_0005914, partial [Dichanthelium oligosanthes]